MHLFNFTMGHQSTICKSSRKRTNFAPLDLPQLPETKAKKLRQKGEGGNLLCSFGKLETESLGQIVGFTGK